MPGNYSKEIIQDSEHSESLKSSIFTIVLVSGLGGISYPAANIACTEANTHNPK
jgi:hypothetical protein